MTKNETENFQGGRIFFILSINEACFKEFAARCKMGPHELVGVMEDAVRFRHHEATHFTQPGHPRPLWRLELETIRFTYQVLPGEDVEVGGLVCRLDGRPYEPSQDLLADFTE